VEATTQQATLARRLFDEHGASIRRYFRRLTGDHGEADDLAQEVFLRVVRAAPSYEPAERERAWLFRIARNVFLDGRRREARSPVVDARADAATSATQVVRSGIREALATLPTEDREAFLLAEVAGLSYAEIASATGSTVPSVRSRIYRARLALRARLSPPAPEGPRAVQRHEDDD
jgi:RNA polymerase sigma-70 factor (ECF subfamily)